MPAYRTGILAAAFLAALCVHAPAQTQQQHDWCYDPKATDPQTIEGCSALIDAHTLSGRKLAIVLYDRGLSYEATTQYSLALVDFSQAVALDPNYADAFDDRGNVFTKTSQYAQAIKDFNEAIRLKSDVALYYSNRGYTYYLMSNNDLALDDLNRALGLDTKTGRIYVNRALVYFAKKDCAHTAQDLLSAHRLNWDYKISDAMQAQCGAAMAQYLPDMVKTPAK